MTRIVLDVYAGLLGLVVGSFLNVVVHRLPRGQSLVRPRSRCPWCGAPIRALDNLPVLSFLLLRGRCRHCSGPISWRYPLMELVTALLFVVSMERFGPGWASIAGAVLSAFLLALAAIDLEHFLLPDSLTLPGIAVGVALRAAISRPDWPSGLVSGAAGALVGAFLGWTGVAVTFVVACALGAAAGLTLLATQRAGRKTRLPFGVFLALGGLVALYAGTMLVDRYLALL